MNEPQRAGDLLKDILRKAGVDKSRTRYEQALDKLLSESHRPYLQVLGFRNGRLTLQVDSAPLFSEFNGFRREELRRSINELVPDRPVAQLLFRLGGTGRV